jgi:putative DNA primase/helicase
VLAERLELLAQADLTPLKGRSVVLWPDNDASGKSCMDVVADQLHQIGSASVRVIALDVFKRKPTLKNDKPTFAKGGQWMTAMTRPMHRPKVGRRPT